MCTYVPQVRDVVNVTGSTTLHNNVTEEDEELESVPELSENMIHNVQNLLACR